MQKENVKLGIRQMQLHLHRQQYQILLYSKSHAYITYVCWMVLGLLQRNLAVVDEFGKTWPEKQPNGFKQLSGSGLKTLGSRNQRRRKSSLHSKLQAFAWAAKNMLRHLTCQNFRMDIKDLITMIRESFA
ncbi:unnamed protein product [Brassica rapa]|uniref:Uncharacterized protein n=1 Tax=Brassica campestris TaxID=3711 RepID=A0A3P5ZDA8_BRACM|nr:unnamed protein product [Brassica rapa]VDC70860.1 unnamed protein product [Brassica rapa]